MYQGLREILLSGIANRQTIIHFPNGEYPDITSGIYSGTLKLEEILNSGEILNFGECNATKFEATLTGVQDISNLIIEVYQKITYDSSQVDVIVDRNRRYIVTRDGQRIAVGQRGDYTVPIFYGRVDSSKLQPDRIHRNIIAYDELYYKGDVNCAEWYNSLFNGKGSVTIKAFRNSLFSFIGIKQETVKLIHDSLKISKTIDTNALKFADLIKAICQLNGVFGHIDRTGVFRYIDLTTSVNTYDISNNYRSNDSDYESYVVKNIDKVQIRSDEEDIGAIVGEGDNPYIMQGNFLIYGKTAAKLESIATTIFNKVSKIKYRPVDVCTIYSEPYITVGDILTFSTKRDGETIETLVLNTILSGVQLLKQELIAEGDEYRDEVVDDVNAEIVQLKGKTLKILKTVDQYSVRIEVLETGSAELSLTVNGLTTQVENAEGQLSTMTQSANKIEWLVSGDSESNFTITDKALELISDSITLTGYVTFNDLSKSGKTEINGDNITTGSLDCELITANGENLFYVTSNGVQIAYDSYFDNKDILIGGGRVLVCQSDAELAFFGASGSGRQAVASVGSSAALAAVRTSYIGLLNTLSDYGLIDLQ